jgi:hypothetical protein
LVEFVFLNILNSVHCYVLPLIYLLFKKCLMMPKG